MNDIENKLGDVSLAPAVAVPRNLGVSVGRRGVEVALSIGNAGPFYYTWQEAMRLGHTWAKEGHAATKGNRPAELRIKQGKICTNGQTLVTIGGWMMAKASEAKLLAGDMKKQIET